LDSWFKSYGVLKFSAHLRACCQPVAMQQNLPKYAQNCPKLPKFSPKQLTWGTLKYHKKLRF
jgi:hypothetical protein